MFSSSKLASALIKLLIRVNLVTILAFMAAVSLSITTTFSSAYVKSLLENIKIQSILVEAFRSEFHALPSMDNLPSATELTFELLVNIQPKDIRTYLGNEIPGLSIFHTEIAVAGKGTDITNLPIESPPPLELITQINENGEQNTGLEEKPSVDTPSNNKSVFIYHSHSWEAFKPLSKNLADSSMEEVANVIAVGDKLKQSLEARGIGAQHSRQNATAELATRNWKYNHSYLLSRDTVQEAMANNADLKYLIDIHRDSQPKEITTITINQKKYARLFFIVGKEHKSFEKNLKFAKKLNSELEKKYPGISRGVFIKGESEGNGVYNQDLTERSLLLEFGGVDNDMNELQNAIEAFAEIFSVYYWQASEI